LYKARKKMIHCVPLLATLLLLLGTFLSVAALPIPNGNVSVFYGSMAINVEGSFTQCCGGVFNASTSSQMSRSVSSLNDSVLRVYGACNGGACDCYNSGWSQSLMDVTSLYHSSCHNGSLTVQCTTDMSCPAVYMNFSYVNVTKGAKGVYWPSPNNGTCTDSDGFHCMRLQYVSEVNVPCTVTTDSYCEAVVPMPDPSIAGGALILTLNAYFGDRCGNMECSYGGRGLYSMTCELLNVTCATSP
jgi:hypothetical protein